MKIYKVKVNGKVYEVELEAVSETAGSIIAPASAPVANEAPAPAPVSTPAVTGGATIDAPIAGKLLSINVKVGDVVAKNQIVAVIEAMKLENEIPSSVAGKVVEIRANVGSMVNNKDVLFVLE